MQKHVVSPSFVLALSQRTLTPYYTRDACPPPRFCGRFQEVEGGLSGLGARRGFQPKFASFSAETMVSAKLRWGVVFLTDLADLARDAVFSPNSRRFQQKRWFPLSCAWESCFFIDGPNLAKTGLVGPP